MGVLFISHSSRNEAKAIEIRDWLRVNGWPDIFLDLDPVHGLAPGQRWQDELKRAGERCSAVLVLISPDWVTSQWCQIELSLATQLGKQIFGIVVAPTSLDTLPPPLTEYQIVDVSDPKAAPDNFERLRWGLKRAGLDPTDFAWPPPTDPRRPPYRGLRGLEEEDAGIFFGRDAAITRALDALRRMRDGAPERLLVVLGASGAGKSSFLKAGVVARLRRDEEHFIVMPVVRPSRAPLSGPEGLLAAVGVSACPSVAAILGCLDAVRSPVVDRLARFANASRETYLSKPPTIVLAIDQAEELFRSETGETSECLELMRRLVHADDNLVVILTIRSDSYALLQTNRHVADVPRLPFDLSPLSPAAFKQVIEGPGRLADPPILFEPDLTDRLVVDLNQSDGLPLLAFTLERLVAEYGAGQKIGLSEYEHRFGGLQGAIDKAIESVFARAASDPPLPPDRALLEDLARCAFIPWLVRLSDAEGAPARRVAARSELPESTLPLVEHFINQRLLTTNFQDDESTVEVSHEAVLRHWTVLGRWIDDERANLLALDTARRAASEWLRRENDKGADVWLLHRGDRLAQAEALFARAEYVQLLGHEGGAYLKACRAREDAEREESQNRLRTEQQQLARQRRLQRRAAIALALVAAIVVVFGVVAVAQSRSASRETSLVLSDAAQRAISERQYERAARLGVLAAREGWLNAPDSAAAPTLAAAAYRSALLMDLPTQGREASWLESMDGSRWLSWNASQVVRVWDAASGAALGRHAHRDRVKGAAFAPDGRRVLSWSADAVFLWDAVTGQDLGHRDHGDAVRGAHFSPDGQRVLSWGEDGAARVWDTRSGADLGRHDHGALVVNARFSSRGEHVLSWGFDGVVSIWNAMSGLEQSHTSHTRLALGARFSPDEQRVLSWGDDHVIRIWDALTGAEVGHYRHDREVTGAEFSSDGKRVLWWSSDGTVGVWEIATRDHLWRYSHWPDDLSMPAQDPGATFSPDGTRVLSWGRNGVVRVTDTDSGVEVARQMHTGPVAGAQFSADGTLGMSWGIDGTVLVWKTSSKGSAVVQHHSGRVVGATFSADALRVLSWGSDGVALVWDAVTGAEIARHTHEAAVRGATLVSQDRRVLSWAEDGTARVWSATSTTEVARQMRRCVVRGTTFSSDGRRLLSWGEDGSICVWEPTTGREVARFNHDAAINGAVFSHDDRRVLSWADDGTVRLWDVASQREVAHLRHGKSDLFAVGGAALIAGERRVISWGFGLIRVWDVDSARQVSQQSDAAFVMTTKDGQRVLSSIGERYVVWDATSSRVLSRDPDRADQSKAGGSPGAVFAPDEHRVLSWTGRTARVWNTDTGAEFSRHQHPRAVRGARFADSRRVLSWSADGSAEIWDAITGSVIAAHMHSGEVRQARFASDGRRVLSWADDGIVRVWDAGSGAEIARHRHAGGVASATFDNANRLVLSVGSDSVAAVWDARTGAQLGQHANASGATFSPDGRQVLSSALEGAVNRWDAATIRIWDAITGTDFVVERYYGGQFTLDGRYVIAWERGKEADLTTAGHVLDVGWSLPRESNSALIGEVCRRVLRPQTRSPIGEPAESARLAVSQISVFDAQVVPLLRQQVGHDVCGAYR